MTAAQAIDKHAGVLYWNQSKLSLQRKQLRQIRSQLRQLGLTIHTNGCKQRAPEHSHQSSSSRESAEK